MKDAQEISKARPVIAKKLVEAVARACSACKLVVKTDESERTTQTIRPVTPLTSREKLDALPQGMSNGDVEGCWKWEKRETVKDPSLTRPMTIVRFDYFYFSFYYLLNYFADELSHEKIEISRSSKDFSNERREKNLVQDAKKDTVDPRLKQPNIDVQMLVKTANDLYCRLNYSITTHASIEKMDIEAEKKMAAFGQKVKSGIDTRVKYLSNEFGHRPNVSFVASDNTTKLPANESQRPKGYSFLWYCA